jgi:S1-C subfamily serine protease
LECGHGAGDGDVVVVAPQPTTSPPSEHGRDRDANALPAPPSREELEQVAPAIRAAIAANVFLHARDGEQTWNGSGIIIGREGNHIAILTNRHVVESDESRQLCAVTAKTVMGEATGARVLWRASRGVDLALLEAEIRLSEDLGVMPLGTGNVLVGAEVFSIGNPLGLAWSYSAGTLSAIRKWTTSEGQSVRILQTDASIAPGSSGGGLFHRDGHLLGVVSFGRQASSGSSAHFAFSIEAVREALTRDGVQWRGKAVADATSDG